MYSACNTQLTVKGMLMETRRPVAVPVCILLSSNDSNMVITRMALGFPSVLMSDNECSTITRYYL